MKTETIIADGDLPADVAAAIAEGRKIVAIKLLREATGLGLANAKVIVDRAAARHESANPRSPKLTEESNTARLLGVLALLLIAFVAYRTFFGG